MECWYLTSLHLPGSSPLMPIESISNGESRNRWSLPREDTSPCWTRPGDGRKLRRGTSLQPPFRWEAEGNGATWERWSGGEVSTGFNYFLRQRTPSLVISTRSPAVVSSARIASEA